MGLIASRSSLSAHHKLEVGAGVIDQGLCIYFFKNKYLLIISVINRFFCFAICTSTTKKRKYLTTDIMLVVK